MPSGPRVIIENALYHIMVRGNQKQKVFDDEHDFGKYLKLIKRYKKKWGFRLYGFCLMPNHIHLIGEALHGENLAKFMQGLNRSYTAYFNKKYGKVGHLWQGRFNSKVILKDKYVIDCINYIELNPLRANMVGSPCEYKWSSYKERILSEESGERLLELLSL
ncbi:MAG: transposase [Candidatus Omnitrophota bacterium]|jgi:putative transposase